MNCAVAILAWLRGAAGIDLSVVSPLHGLLLFLLAGPAARPSQIAAAANEHLAQRVGSKL
jgi:hypothetical protein